MILGTHDVIRFSSKYQKVHIIACKASIRLTPDIECVLLQIPDEPGNEFIA